MHLEQYLEVFIEESKEHLQICNDQLLELEKNPDNLAIVNEIFRAAHTLKGMSATMGYDDLAHLTHQMENVLDEIRNERLAVNPDILDIVFLAVDDLETMVLSIAEGKDGKRDVTSTIEKLEHLVTGQTLTKSNEPESEISSTLADPGFTMDTYDEYEWTVIEQSIEQDYSVYQIKVILREH